ncbi:PREDICTED: putative nuclease HARBI1 [Cyphomyrmex costatus]|uniref:Putative nuclease HARBI1 n=1 Tax=Cyphomyrmex costatus TaxID=456900 RepID=A0A151IIF3_9HYME|nr:PREDICTED: putative nuclease HARBI1 [Cyphomyrmex costatus]KYN02337.1 Putative nuclease HARBI1 [Cyphomyrmex costatus]
MATPDSYRSICEKFDVSRATALGATRRVVKALYDLAPAVIKWPSGNNVNEVLAGFEANSGFPKVIGAIDGTHINIPAPRIQPALYVNRKGYHPVQLQDIQDLCTTSEYFGYRNCKSG